jgi:hypothetical protein
MFKILSILIFNEKKFIKCNIWRVAVRPSYIYNARFLKVKYLLQYNVILLYDKSSVHSTQDA